jgi:hypothetical protein
VGVLLHIKIPEMCGTSVQNGKLLYFSPFDNTLHLKTIIIGCHAHMRVTEIQNALHYGGWQDVSIKLANLSPTDYRMDIVNYPH